LADVSCDMCKCFYNSFFTSVKFNAVMLFYFVYFYEKFFPTSWHDVQKYIGFCKLIT